jgi:rubrerythrin
MSERRERFYRQLGVLARRWGHVFCPHCGAYSKGYPTKCPKCGRKIP